MDNLWFQKVRSYNRRRRVEQSVRFANTLRKFLDFLRMDKGINLMRYIDAEHVHRGIPGYELTDLIDQFIAKEQASMEKEDMEREIGG